MPRYKDYLKLAQAGEGAVITYNVCRISIIFLVCTPLVVLVTWLSVSLSIGLLPNCSLQQFYIPSLDKTVNSPENTTLFFTLKLKNLNEDEGVYYEPINVTFFDSPSKNHSIGNFLIPKFYQGKKKTAIKGGQVETSGLDREAAIRAITANGSAVLRVDLVTSVRFRYMFWKTKKSHSIKVGADVKVNDEGTKINPNKDILLSHAAKLGSHGWQLGMVLVNFFLFAYINF